MKPLGKAEAETISVLLAAFLGQILMDLLNNQFLVGLIVVVPVFLTLTWWLTHLLLFKNQHRGISGKVLEFAHGDVGLLAGVAAGKLAADMPGLVAATSIAIAVLAVIGFAAGIVIGFAYVRLMRVTLGFKDP